MQDPIDNPDSRKTGTSNSARVDAIRRKEDDRRMESHLESLDKRMAAVETDVAVIRSNYATKADVAALHSSVAIIQSSVSAFPSIYATKADLTKLESNMIRWVVATAIAQLGLVMAFFKYLH